MACSTYDSFRCLPTPSTTIVVPLPLQAGGGKFKVHRGPSPPRWEASHLVLRSLCSPTSTAVTDSLDFRVALLPYKSSSLVRPRFPCHPYSGDRISLSMLTHRDIPDSGQRSSLYPPIKKFSNVMGSLFSCSHFSLFLFFPAAIGVLPCVFYLSVYLFPSSSNLLYHLTGFRNSCTLSHR